MRVKASLVNNATKTHREQLVAKAAEVEAAFKTEVEMENVPEKILSVDGIIDKLAAALGYDETVRALRIARRGRVERRGGARLMRSSNARGQ